MKTTIEELKSILNLRTNESIGEELANRQLDVIIKSYLFLCKKNNNIIYIADEVGLGKTYIAAGIAMLFRHFNNNHHDHKDVIIVPKKNLQEKWKKELKNFVDFNYLSKNDIIRKQYNYDDSIKSKVMPIKEADPITILRMTSFSNIAASRNRKNELYSYLIEEIFTGNDLAINVMNKSWKLGYFKKGSESHLRKIVSYLINALSPKIDCLIIDEAHNYKYGVGEENHDESIRNETTARFLGAVEDRSILKYFPKLRSKIKFPIANKIICLSATPKDRGLLEIKKQFDCFADKHILSKALSAKEIEPLLKKFLIRGNLEYSLNGESVSRNQCRQENRLGNINKSEIPEILEVNDSFESIFWQLLQYKSIKHLSQKNNASFEIGMLAGFESYNIDLVKKASASLPNLNEIENHDDRKKEYEQTAHRKIKESQDFDILKGITKSYQEKYNTFPPHPKQTKLENEIIQQLSRQEKSLIFVRRVATAYELAKRITEKYEKELVIEKYLNFKGKFAKYKSTSIKELIETYQNRKNIDKLDNALFLLIRKKEIKTYILKNIGLSNTVIEQSGVLWLKIAFYNNENREFKKVINEFISKGLKNISNYLMSLTIRALKKSFSEFKKHIESDESDFDLGHDEPQSGYFFLDYFKKGNNGFTYRQKIYRENWFEINPIILNNKFKFIEYNIDELNKILSEIKVRNVKKNQAYNESKNKANVFFSSHGKIKLNSNTINTIIPGILKKNTFITSLLCGPCNKEIKNWISNKIKHNGKNNILLDIKILNSVLRSYFRNGIGLLPGFASDSLNSNYEHLLMELITNIESPFHFILEEIKTIINDYDLIIAVNFQEKDESRVGNVLKNLTPIVGTSGEDKRDRGILASQFRMPGFPYVLITTDIFREGEDLHTYCQNIYHYGIAWNPSDMEQRTGRIDRINSLSYRKLNKTQELNFESKVHVFYPYLIQSLEVNQVIELLKNLNKFTETFNDLNLENYYKSNVCLNKEYTENSIPPPITIKLKSNYDVHDFKVD